MPNRDQYPSFGELAGLEQVYIIACFLGPAVYTGIAHRSVLRGFLAFGGELVIILVVSIPIVLWTKDEVSDKVLWLVPLFAAVIALAISIRFFG